MTEEQAKHAYKKIESGGIINTHTLHQEIEQERQSNRLDDTSGDTTPYKELIVNNAEKIEPLLTQIEQWSTLSNTLNYIQYDRHPKNYHSLGISMGNKCRKNACIIEQERDILELDFGQTPDILREEYLYVYEDIQSEILNTTRFDKINKIKAEEYIRVYQNKDIPWVNYWIEQNVKYCWTQESVSPSCQNHIICDASHSTLYPNLH